MTQSCTMVGRWEPWYRASARFTHSYGPHLTYEIAEAWLKGLAIEDWGCGYARFREMHEGGYLGLDGSGGWADRIVDLRESPTTQRPEGILLRHVLEHNPDWYVVLSHAVAHFEKRLVLILFTPDSESLTSRPIGDVPELGVVDLALPHRVVDTSFAACRTVDRRHYPTATGYQGETVWLVER
jgi:hypothetical protein